MQVDILKKRLARGTQIFFIVFTLIISLGYLFDIITRDIFTGIPEIANWAGIIINVSVLFLFLIKKFSIKVCFGIVTYSLIAISFFSSLILLPNPLAYHYFMRDLTFITILIVFITFILGRSHTIFITLIFCLYIALFTWVSTFSFLAENLILIEIVILTLGLVLNFLKLIFDKAMEESSNLMALLKKRNVEMQNQNELLKEQFFELNAINEALVRKEETLRLNKNELSEANEAKNKLLSIIAHDLKDSVSLIQGTSGFLYEKFESLSPEKRNEFIANIYHGSNKLDELLNNLLQWSKTQSKKIAFTNQSFNLYETVNKTVEQLVSRSNEKRIQINNSVPSSCKIDGDEQLLIIVLRNLISNAIKFSPIDSQIEIASIEFSEHYFIEVIDQGIGIDKEMQKTIFQLRPDQQRYGTLGEKGTGLGLSLCKEFVEMHGGRIGVKSNSDKGSIFWFTIPKMKS